MKDFETLLKENKPALDSFVRFRISSKEDAEDILQDVALRAFTRFSSLRNEESFKPWLLTIARNRLTDYYRKKALNEEVELDEQRAEAFVTVNRTFFSPVRETMSGLETSDRELLEMFYWQKLSVKEIARSLSVPEGTVKSRLHTARNHFRERYPKEELHMSVLPKILPDYTIRKNDKEPFRVRWEELMGWFLVPKEGNRIKWGIYDLPEKTLTEQVEMSCRGRAEVHGVEGVRVDATETQGKHKLKRRFVAQLTDTRCRYLAESHSENGVEKYYTFLDGDAFLNNWGFGPENIGNETDLFSKGTVRREGNEVSTDEKEEAMDLVGRYDVTINGKTYDTVCLMDIGTYDENTVTEQYIDVNGRTVLWRRFNKKNWRWNFDRHEEAIDEKLKNNESITVNGVTCYHWYDCITDYIL